MIEILEEITDKIAGVADYLSAQGNDEYAKSQIYLCFQRYQKAGLFDCLKVLTNKAIKILKRILNRQILNNDVYSAKMTLEELYNLWDSYEIKKDNIDPFLLKMGKLFIEKHDFQKVEVILSKIISSKNKKELTNFRMKEEENIKKSAKKGELEELTNKLKILSKYIEDEDKIFINLNKNLFSQTPELISNKNLLNAINKIKKHAQWLKNIGENEFSYNVWEFLLSLYIENHILNYFIKDINFLPEKLRRNYLKDNYSKIEIIFSPDLKKQNTKFFEDQIKSIMQIYRNHLLYEESKKISEIYINFLKTRSLNFVKKNNLKAIIESINLTNRISSISKRYMDGKKYNLDPIFIKIVEFYIKTDNIKEAKIYNENIFDKSIKSKFHSQMEEIVTSRSSSLAREAENKQKLKIYTEQLSQLQNQARDQKIASENLLKMRKGLKRRYFQKSIDLLSENKLVESANFYFEISEKMFRSKKFELGGVSACVGSLIFLVLEDISTFEQKIKLLNKNLGRANNIFKRTFSGKLMDYVLLMIKTNSNERIKDALKLFYNLALFPEEILILETLLGSKIDFKSIIKKSQQVPEKMGIDISTNYFHLLDKISYDPQLKSRRKVLEDKLFSNCQDYFAQQEYEQASIHYFLSVDNLINRHYNDFVITSLIMGYLSLLKIQNPRETYLQFEKNNFEFTKRYKIFGKSPILNLLEIFLQFFGKDTANKMIIDISETFKKKLYLLDWEISYINRLLRDSGKINKEKSEIPGVISSDDVGEDESLFNEQIIVLNQELLELKPKLDKLLDKRSKMIRTYYKDIIVDLDNNRFKDVSDKYIKLGKRMARRNDFNAASLMMLLSVLASMKANLSIKEIKKKLRQILKKLGIVQKILDDHFGVKIAHFILDSFSLRDKSIERHINNLLTQLPILEQEKKLIKIIY